MTDNRNVGEASGGNAGGDPGTLERERGTAGVRAESDLSPQELSAMAMDLGTPGHTDQAVAASDDKGVYELLPGFDGAELARLSILEAGTALDQGGVYFDLNDPNRGPFKAIGGQEAAAGSRFVAKRDTDYELWNRLVGQDRDIEVERPDVAG